MIYGSLRSFYLLLDNVDSLDVFFLAVGLYLSEDVLDEVLLEVVVVIEYSFQISSEEDQMIDGQFLILQAFQQPLMMIFDLILQYIPQLLIIGLLYIIGTLTDIRSKFPNILQLLDNPLRLLFLRKIFKQLRDDPFIDLIRIKIILMFEDIAILIQYDIAILVVLVD